MAYQWSKNIETGNAMIDAQHKQWLEALNHLLNACAQGKGRDSIRETLLFLQNYTDRHFQDEESLQLQHQFPEYSVHKQYHETFKKVVADIMKEYDQSGPTVALVGKINTNLGGWFINHIQKEDIKVAAHIKSRTQ